MKIRFFDSEDEARTDMRSRNRAHRSGDRELVVMVDGPTDNYAVMDLREAIANDFLYTWEC